MAKVALIIVLCCLAMDEVLLKPTERSQYDVDGGGYAQQHHSQSSYSDEPGHAGHDDVHHTERHSHYKKSRSVEDDEDVTSNGSEQPDHKNSMDGHHNGMYGPGGKQQKRPHSHYSDEQHSNSGHGDAHYTKRYTHHKSSGSAGEHKDVTPTGSKGSNSHKTGTDDGETSDNYHQKSTGYGEGSPIDMEYDHSILGGNHPHSRSQKRVKLVAGEDTENFDVANTEEPHYVTKISHDTSSDDLEGASYGHKLKQFPEERRVYLSEDEGQVKNKRTDSSHPHKQSKRVAYESEEAHFSHGKKPKTGRDQTDEDGRQQVGDGEETGRHYERTGYPLYVDENEGNNEEESVNVIQHSSD